MGYLSDTDEVFVEHLKKAGVVRAFTSKEMENITRNGGVLVTCSDGDIDLSMYHREVVSKRNHEVKVFGGTLNVCEDFCGYDREEENVIVKNIAKGFKAKRTRTLFLGHHFPCGMAAEYKHGIEEVTHLNCLAGLRFRGDLMEALNTLLPQELSLRSERVFDFFHVKRLGDAGREEQKMYLFDARRYAQFF